MDVRYRVCDAQLNFMAVGNTYMSRAWHSSISFFHEFSRSPTRFKFVPHQVPIILKSRRSCIASYIIYVTIGVCERRNGIAVLLQVMESSRCFF
jgi:hypothetical protein